MSRCRAASSIDHCKPFAASKQGALSLLGKHTQRVFVFYAHSEESSDRPGGIYFSSQLGSHQETLAQNGILCAAIMRPMPFTSALTGRLQTNNGRNGEMHSVKDHWHQASPRSDCSALWRSRRLSKQIAMQQCKKLVNRSLGILQNLAPLAAASNCIITHHVNFIHFGNEARNSVRPAQSMAEQKSDFYNWRPFC